MTFGTTLVHIIYCQFVPHREQSLIPLERPTSNCLCRAHSMQNLQCEIWPCTQTEELSLKWLIAFSVYEALKVEKLC